MSMMVQSREKCLSANLKSILKYLDKQYPNYGFDIYELEQDLATGYTDLKSEINNIYKALNTLKKYHNNDQRMCTTINMYIKLINNEKI